MKSRRSVLPKLACCLVAFSAVLLLAFPAFAQRDDVNPAVPMAALGGFLIFWLILSVAGYIYVSMALMTIAQKTNTENGWFAWIPILNIILMLNIANKPIWWIILLLIPFVNIVVGILIWMAIAEARNKPSWWGVMLIVPVMNIIMPGYLAWSD